MPVDSDGETGASGQGSGQDDITQTTGSPQSSGYVVPVEPPAGDDEERREEEIIRQHQKKYDSARNFDKNFRKQIARDRRYAAGTWDIQWAVSANVVGYVIDILTAILYARDPDVNVRKVPQVDDEQPTNISLERWARTLELVISLLWRRAPIRAPLKQQVRGSLSCSTGWLKLLMLTEQIPQPEAQKELDDAMQRKQQIEAQREYLDDESQSLSEEELAYEESELDALIETKKSKIERAVRKEFVTEYLPADSVQLSLDVARDEDYLACGWIAFSLFVPKSELCDRFKRLSSEDVEEAKEYFQQAMPDLAGAPLDNDLPQGQITAEAAELYTTVQSGDDDVAFCRVIEKWSRKDGHIYTWIEGVKRWAKEPFEPAYATSRFYPCFRLAFFEVDGTRHPQSIPIRIQKLQDEYSCVRSNYRLARERSIPGVIFDATNISDEEAKKVAEAKIQEIIAVKPLDPTKPVGNNFAAKPVSPIDPRVFDTTAILQDINRITGVQEALQGASSGPKTATEAQLEQMGMNARSTSDRDALEWMLTEAAIYTAEVAVQAYSTEDIMKMVGAAAIWPEGLKADDVTRLVNICIQAGSTGKPRKAADQQAWGVVLPLIEKILGQIVMARQGGNTALAKALEELIKETMLRMGDDTDVDRFIPQMAAAPPAPPPQPRPNVSISLKGIVPPQDAAAIAAEAVPPGALAGSPLVGQGAAPGAPGIPPGVAAGPPPGQQPGPPGPPPGSVPPVTPLPA